MRPRLRLPSLQAPILAAALLAACAVAVPGSASAGLPTPRQIHREVTGHLLDVLGGVHDVLRVLDPIPVFLEPRYRGEIEVYFGGQEYYGPHRHYHDVYRFPVRIDGSVLYRPHYYCGDRLFTGHDIRFRGPVRYRSHAPRRHGGYDRDRHGNDRRDRERHDRDRWRDDERERRDSDRDRRWDDAREGGRRDQDRDRSRDHSYDRRSRDRNDSRQGWRERNRR